MRETCILAIVEGLIYDKHTRISSSVPSIFDIFLHLFLIRAENCNSQRDDIENCNTIFNAFLAIEGYSYSMEIQNWSMDTSLYLICKPQSADIMNSSSSVNDKTTSSVEMSIDLDMEGMFLASLTF